MDLFSESSNALYFWIALPIVVTLIYSFRKKEEAGYLVMSLIVLGLIFSTFIPSFQIGTDLLSAVDLMRQGSKSLIVMLVGWIISLLFLFNRHPNTTYLSFISYTIASIAAIIGFFIHRIEPTNILPVYLYCVMPLLTWLVHLMLIYLPDLEGRRRTGIFKAFDDLGTNRKSLRVVAQKLNLEFTEGSGHIQANAKGSIKGFKVFVGANMYYNHTGALRYVTAIIVELDNKVFKPALITKKGIDTFMFHFNFDNFLERLSRLPKSFVKNFRLHTAEENRLSYGELIIQNRSDLGYILRNRFAYPSWIVINKNMIVFERPYGNLSYNVSVKEMEVIINTLIKLAKSLDEN